MLYFATFRSHVEEFSTGKVELHLRIITFMYSQLGIFEIFCLPGGGGRGGEGEQKPFQKYT